MNPLEHFLQKIQTLLKASGTNKNHIVEVIQRQTGITLSDTDITVREHSAYIKGSSLLKNELFMRKNAILQELQSMGSPIKDIK